MSHSSVLQEGHAAYVSQRKQQRNPAGQIFRDTLVDGIFKLPNLANVLVRTSWGMPESLDSRSSARLHHGPLARSWNVYWCRPRAFFNSGPRITPFFQALFHAMETTGKSPAYMDLGDCFPLYAEYRHSRIGRISSPSPPAGIIGRSLTALKVTIIIQSSPLKEVLGSVAACHEDIASFWRASISLRYLDINLDSSGYLGYQHYQSVSDFLFESIFDRESLPPITHLSLGGFSGTSSQFVRALHNLRSLREFHLNGFRVTGGDWIEVFHSIRHELDLDCFRLNRAAGRVKVHGLDDEIERWVIQGGENPLQNLPLLGVAGYWNSALDPGD